MAYCYAELVIYFLAVATTISSHCTYSDKIIYVSKAVTHPATNQTRSRETVLSKMNVLSLHQTATVIASSDNRNAQLKINYSQQYDSATR